MERSLRGGRDPRHLKAGGVYVPLDLSYPPKRVAFMFEDAEAGWISR